MSTQKAFEGIDCAWIATDSDGYMAAFITAGVGPIPSKALNESIISLEEIEEEILKLPVSSTAKLLVSVKRPDSFIDLAERGLFVFDWSDIHRTLHQALNKYELMAIPNTPLPIDLVPEPLRSVACKMKLDISFGAEKLIAVSSL